MKQKAQWPAVVFPPLIGTVTLLLTYVVIDPRFVERWHWPHFILSVLATGLAMFLAYKLFDRRPKQNILVLQPESWGTLKLSGTAVVVRHLNVGHRENDRGPQVMHYQVEVIDGHDRNLGFFTGSLKTDGRKIQIYPSNMIKRLDTPDWPYKLLVWPYSHSARFKLVKA